LQVLVRGEDVDQALRVLKKKLQREGFVREMRLRRFCEKPSARAARKKTEAIRRSRKLAYKQAIRDGLTVATRKKRPEPAKADRTMFRPSASTLGTNREAHP
jgi:small subunit ribosomal protein S21